MLQSAEQQINELETRSESWRQEVPGSLFLNVVSYMVPSDLREGSVDDSRKRIAAAVRQLGTKSKILTSIDLIIVASVVRTQDAS